MDKHSTGWIAAIAALALSTARAGAQTEVSVLAGSSAGDEFGWALAAVGDVDNDGVGDFAIGAPLADANGTDSGEVRVYSGRTRQVIRSWAGLGPSDFFGYSIAAAGDLDGDGFADVLVGAPETYDWYDLYVPFTGPGYAQVFSGQSGVVLHHIQGPAADSGAGLSVAGGGDVDGDSIPDLLIGGPGNPSSTSGRVLVVSGATGSAIRTHTGGVTFGFSCAFVGDVDGDGRDEYSVGQWFFSSVSIDGSVFLYSGASGSELWHKDGWNFGQQLGWTVAGVGDQDGDAKPDVLAHGHADGCWPSWNCSPNQVVVLSSANGSVIRTHFEPQGFGVALGEALADLGDVDGDGVSDYAAGAPQAEFCCFSSVMPTRVWSGASGTQIASMMPAVHDLAYGFSTAHVDGNGDGLADLLVGDPLDDVSGADAGAVHVFSFVRTPTTYCEAKANSQGCTPFVLGVGTPSAGNNQPFRIKAFQVLNNKNGLLFYGFAPQSVPFQGGALCLKTPVTRCPVLGSGGNPPPTDCSGSFAYDFNDRIRSGVDPLLVVGAEVFAQYWSRDPGDPFTTSLSDALAFYINP